jgi:hypothetical protein
MVFAVKVEPPTVRGEQRQDGERMAVDVFGQALFAADLRGLPQGNWREKPQEARKHREAGLTTHRHPVWYGGRALAAVFR